MYSRKAAGNEAERMVPEPFLHQLYHNLKFIQEVFGRYDFEFGANLLEALAKFLEENFIEKLNFKECLQPNGAKCKVIAKMLWFIMGSQPATFLDRKISHWTKRIYNCIFIGSNLPLPLEADDR